MSKLFQKFGKKKGSSKSSKNSKDKNGQSEEEIRSSRVNDAIQALNNQISTLEKQKNHTKGRIDRLTSEAALAARNKDKKTAIYKLKLRKNLEKRLEKIGSSIMNLEIQKLSLDDVLSNANIVSVTEKANEVLKYYVNDEQIEKAEQIRDELQEQMDMQQDLTDILNEPLQYGVPIDETELEDELDKLLEEEEEDILFNEPDIPLNTQFSNKQANKQVNKQLSKEEENEFKELELELNEIDDIKDSKDSNIKEIKLDKIEKKRIDVTQVTRANAVHNVILCF